MSKSELNELVMELKSNQAKADSEHHEAMVRVDENTIVVKHKTNWAVWQNYVIMALMICVYFESSAISRLNSENDRLFQKNQEHAETKEAVLGLVFNAPYRLKYATRSTALRPDGFPFVEWNPGLTSKVVMVAVESGNMRSLEWVTRQPNWESVLSENTVIAVRAAIENKHRETLPAKSIAELKEELRIKTDEAAQLSECRARLKNELSNAISREAVLKELLLGIGISHEAKLQTAFKKQKKNQSVDQ
mgnify:FL=1|tara:strand:+ start:108 stop:851 length:744 start_codon:yes stop_codon:yes gene_type:complete